MFGKNKTEQVADSVLTDMLTKLQDELTALRAVSVRTETRLCKLIEHQGATEALGSPKRRPNDQESEMTRT